MASKSATPAEANTGTTTIGLLPDSMGIVLVGLCSLGILGMAAAVQYSLGPIIVLLVAGVVAAAGMRVASRSNSTHVSIGVTLLWLAALVFTWATISIVLESFGIVGLSGFHVGLLVGTMGLLAPYGVASSTVRTYGHGTGRKVLRRYFYGTLVLVGIAATIYLGPWVWQLAGNVAVELVGTVGAGDSILGRGVIGIVLYWIALYLLDRTAGAFPAEIFVSPAEFDRIASVRERTETIYSYGKYALLGYAGLIGVTVFVIPDVMPALGPYTRLLIAVGAFPPLLTGVTVLVMGMLGVLLALRLLHWIGEISPRSVIEICVPPVVLALLLVPVSIHYGGSVVFYTIVCSIALVLGAVVLSIPSMIASVTPGDESLAGIAASVFALVVFVLVVTLAGVGTLTILFGVAIAAIVWELGEYATVAAGEIQPATSGRSFDSGISKITSIHAAATVAVTVCGVLVAVAVLTLGSAIPATMTAAAAILVLSGAGLAALLVLFAG